MRVGTIKSTQKVHRTMRYKPKIHPEKHPWGWWCFVENGHIQGGASQNTSRVAATDGSGSSNGPPKGEKKGWLFGATPKNYAIVFSSSWGGGGSPVFDSSGGPNMFLGAKLFRRPPLLDHQVPAKTPLCGFWWVFGGPPGRQWSQVFHFRGPQRAGSAWWRTSCGFSGTQKWNDPPKTKINLRLPFKGISYKPAHSQTPLLVFVLSGKSGTQTGSPKKGHCQGSKG